MRKCRSVIEEIEEDVLMDLYSENIFSFLDESEIPIPEWANLSLVFCRPEKGKLDASFFEETTNFFIWYNKAVLFYDYIDLFCFERTANGWIKLEPPTLIGSHFESKLR